MVLTNARERSGRRLSIERECGPPKVSSGSFSGSREAKSRSGQYLSFFDMRNLVKRVQFSRRTYSRGVDPRESVKNNILVSTSRIASMISNEGTSHQQASCKTVRPLASQTRTSAPNDIKRRKHAAWLDLQAVCKTLSPCALDAFGETPAHRHFRRA